MTTLSFDDTVDYIFENIIDRVAYFGLQTSLYPESEVWLQRSRTLYSERDSSTG